MTCYWITTYKTLPPTRTEVLVAIRVTMTNGEANYLREIAFVDDDGVWHVCYPARDDIEIHPEFWAELLDIPTPNQVNASVDHSQTGLTLPLHRQHKQKRLTRVNV